MKKTLLSLLLLCSFVFAQAGIHVEAYDEQQPNIRQMTLRLRVVNSTNETFNNVRLKYYMPYNASRTLQVNPYYTPGATVSQEVVNDQIEINIDFPTLAPGMFPNESGMSIGINYADWQSFDKTASVSEGTEQTRSVAFDCGVTITNTLKNMGVKFIIRAPEDISVTNELNAMSEEQQNSTFTVPLDNNGSGQEIDKPTVTRKREDESDE